MGAPPCVRENFFTLNHFLSRISVTPYGNFLKSHFYNLSLALLLYQYLIQSKIKIRSKKSLTRPRKCKCSRHEVRTSNENEKREKFSSVRKSLRLCGKKLSKDTEKVLGISTLENEVAFLFSFRICFYSVEKPKNNNTRV